MSPAQGPAGGLGAALGRGARSGAGVALLAALGVGVLDGAHAVLSAAGSFEGQGEAAWFALLVMGAALVPAALL
ncbi:MAG: hypothetical protein JO352_08090, partial [Chloroflexi bacterium]|nr:hypothetical protein [Chloroflexota bacterium]